MEYELELHGITTCMDLGWIQLGIRQWIGNWTVSRDTDIDQYSTTSTGGLIVV